MDEYGETPTIHIWPKAHEEGSALPDNFWRELDDLLVDNGYGWERV